MHDAYDGLFLVTIGMLIQWPTLLTILMWPILMVVYYRLARREERVCEEQFGEAYRAYKAQVPAFVPRLFRKKPVSFYREADPAEDKEGYQVGSSV